MPSLLIELVSAAVFITAPAVDVPVKYTAHSGNTVLGYRRFDGWVPEHLCFGQCLVPAGEAPQLLGGDLSLPDMATLEIDIRANGKKAAEFRWLFQAGPVIWNYQIE